MPKGCTKINNYEKLEILEKFKAGETIANLTKQYAFSRYEITKILKQFGLNTKKNLINFYPFKCTPDVRKEIVELYKTGINSSVLADRFKVSCSGILLILEKEGVKRRSSGIQNSKQGIRTCSRCKKDLPLDLFSGNKGNPHNKSYICKACSADYLRKNRTGTNKFLYETLVKLHDNKCMICGKEESMIQNNTGKVRKLVADHSHVTGKTRGVLCAACNLGLGSFKDDINILKSAIHYLAENNTGVQEYRSFQDDIKNKNNKKNSDSI